MSYKRKSTYHIFIGGSSSKQAPKILHISSVIEILSCKSPATWVLFRNGNISPAFLVGCQVVKKVQSCLLKGLLPALVLEHHLTSLPASTQLHTRVTKLFTLLALILSYVIIVACVFLQSYLLHFDDFSAES